MLPWAALGRRWHLLTLASKPNCPGWMMYLLGSGEQVTEPIQANKGEFVIRLLGCHRTQGQLTPGTKNVAGSPKSPCSSSFFAFPEYMLYSHSVDFLLFSYSYSTHELAKLLLKKFLTLMIYLCDFVHSPSGMRKKFRKISIGYLTLCGQSEKEP